MKRSGIALCISLCVGGTVFEKEKEMDTIRTQASERAKELS